MLYVIGLGLGDCKDITVKGLDIIRKCDRVYLESYTSILGCSTEELEEFYGQKPIIADRELVEQYADVILEGAGEKNIAFLVVGDPFGATTHTDLILRAKQNNIKVKVIHNASIMNAVGCCGLQLYTFGETISIPYWTDSWKPDSFFEKILSNFKRNLHTLCLLDIKVKEPTIESLTKKKREYMPPLFMSVKEASAQLLEILDKHKDNDADAQFYNGREWRNEEYCGVSFTKRIIGGMLSGDRKYPWIVRLGYRTSIKGRYLFLCGGTLINKKFVITAAHCLDNKDPIEIVRLGETTIICASPKCKDPRVQQVFVKKASKHPKFSETSGFADIALLELAHPVQYTDFVRPICLANRELAVVGRKGIAAGFGMENYITRERPEGLKELLMTIIPGSKCKNHFPKSDFNSKNFICAGGKDGEDTCNGDSGGPLMQVFNLGNGPRMHLLGTISFGSFKCGAGIPGIFTSVHFHWKWIMQIVL